MTTSAKFLAQSTETAYIFL